MNLFIPGICGFVGSVLARSLLEAAENLRVCGVSAQGKTVLKDFDVVKEAGGRRKAVVKEFRGLEVEEKLALDLVPKSRQPEPRRAPILQTVEVVRERMLAVGLSVPSITLNESGPAQKAEVRLANQKDEAFAGTLRVASPTGFAVTPGEVALSLPSATKTQLVLNVSVARKAAPGKYAADLRLVRRDGATEAARKWSLSTWGAAAASCRRLWKTLTWAA